MSDVILQVLNQSGPVVGTFVSYSHGPGFKSVQILVILPNVSHHPVFVHKFWKCI